MLKLIMKNLWSRRRRNGWLLAELILVTVVSWAILDPVVVTTYDRSLPFGYDADRLCVVSLAVLPPDAAGYVPEPQDSATRVNNFFNLVRHVENHPSVEMASPLLGNMYLNSTGMNMAEYFTEGPVFDEIKALGEELFHGKLAPKGAVRVTPRKAIVTTPGPDNNKVTEY